MFERILSLFQTEAPVTRLAANDARHAIGALLVRAARIDQFYLFEEIEQIDDVLSHRYGLTAEDAAILRGECEVLEESMPETLKAAPLLQDATSYEDREATVLALWEVVFADGREVETESALLDQLSMLLGVSREKSKALRALVQNAHR